MYDIMIITELPTFENVNSHEVVLGSGGSMLGPGGHRPPKSCPGPPNFFQGNSVLLLVDVISSIVISLSRCCLPTDEGPGPPNIFPRTVPGFGNGSPPVGSRG